MKKFSKFGAIAILASSIVSGACANWYDGVFVGVEGKYNIKSKFETKWTENITPFMMNLNIDDSVFGLGLKVGYDFDLWRIYGAYNHNFEAKDSVAFIGPALGISVAEELKYSTNDFLIGADWTPKFNIAGLDFKAILGAFAGISKIDVEYFAQDSVAIHTSDYSQNGFIYGLKLGGIYEINQNNEIEFGLKFDQAKYSDKDFQIKECIGGTCIQIPTTAKDAKRTNIGVFVGYNYKF
nr:hypothetical protein [Campylobacter sp.]